MVKGDLICCTRLTDKLSWVVSSASSASELSGIDEQKILRTLYRSKGTAVIGKWEFCIVKRKHENT